MADPVSWLLIEPGWRVLADDGSDAGRVEAVIGDSNADIFDGLSIASGVLAQPKYVPSEQVGEINEGAVHLTLSPDEVSSLGEYREPAESIDVEAEPASRFAQMEETALGPDVREHREGVVRRVLGYLGLAGRR